ncbi:hypothetical protein CTAYLR_009077 [Chrysophaeum taylorii]|uniref:Kinesin-like protein n=1 Tax=Chrysophaeum taylorii TaxID=2483200 RepID=A0AAD7UKH0_9STRA|nr:hypothetical protein CTAYLR_009077 [Chrysophaeum taylorii]
MDKNHRAVTVAVRVRPLCPREAASQIRVVESRGTRVAVLDPIEDASSSWRREFGCDLCFDDDADGRSPADQQAAVFEGLGLPLLKHAWAGYDCALLAYGQTGAGKTYSMTGDDGDGLIPRVCSALFEAISESGDTARVEASYMEIYNESVRDLLLPTGRPLRVREHPRRGAYVPDLTAVRVSTREEVAAIASVGNRARATAATRANARSSRSHAVFTLTVERQASTNPGGSAAGWWSNDATPRGTTTTARIRLVDLAGSERVSTTGTDGARLREAKSINRSLATLCDVVEALGRKHRPYDNNDDDEDLDAPRSVCSSVEAARSSASLRVSPGRLNRSARHFVPYRNSTLTWLLKDSLGGRSVVTMIACVSPAEHHYDETIATLKYAERAKRVRTRPPANVALDRATTKPLASPRVDPGAATTPSKTRRRRREAGPALISLDEPAPLLARRTKTWPNLTNLNPDPEFAGRRVWPLDDGGVCVVGAGLEATVRLRGGDVRSKHALLATAREDAENPESTFVVLVALAGAKVHVDGQPLDTATRCDALVLTHGARVVFAGFHAFRFEARKDDSLDATDATSEWNAAQRELGDDCHDSLARLRAQLKQLPPAARAHVLSDLTAPLLTRHDSSNNDDDGDDGDDPSAADTAPLPRHIPAPKVHRDVDDDDGDDLPPDVPATLAIPVVSSFLGDTTTTTKPSPRKNHDHDHDHDDDHDDDDDVDTRGIVDIARRLPFGGGGGLTPTKTKPPCCGGGDDDDDDDNGTYYSPSVDDDLAATRLRMDIAQAQLDAILGSSGAPR